ncbi:hypothetical protein [Undibacterium sp. Xuan67W]|uniref:hypothetical protein n=1 Tax=Undibacterium sp. Xuan67W TaxID=3413057 RepID=UPI003BF3C21F
MPNSPDRPSRIERHKAGVIVDGMRRWNTIFSPDRRSARADRMMLLRGDMPVPRMLGGAFFD